MKMTGPGLATDSGRASVSPSASSRQDPGVVAHLGCCLWGEQCDKGVPGNRRGQVKPGKEWWDEEASQGNGCGCG